MSVAADPGLRDDGVRDGGPRAGARAVVRVPASSANLGPGFDSLGLALQLHDEVELEVTGGGCEVAVAGEGAGAVAAGEDHLVVRAVRAAFDHVGAAQPGLRLSCRNAIPHGRGLGSSAAAVVAGLVAARGCLRRPELLDDDAVLAIATRFEGHPDNAAAALLGGCTISWLAAGDAPRAVRLDVHADVRPLLCVPDADLSTHHARTLLPAAVAHTDAAFNAGRAALLVEALAHRPELLLAATEDRLHQAQRAAAMPATAALLHRVRAAGAAAAVSGAGPSLLVLGTGGGPADAVAAALRSGPAGGAAGWTVLPLGIDTYGATLTTDGD